ncbi:MAG: recombinase family protein [Candidatus Omnitrophota bacterium]|jgi:site-specific DNA recombinase
MVMETQKITKLIAVYARVSTARQEEEGTIQTQLSAIKDYADKSEFTIVKIYKDEGWSGDILARPELDQLRMDAKQKNWEAVLFYDPARLARRYSYQELVIDELREIGIDVLFVTRESPRNAEEKILYGVTGLFAEYERTKIAERFRLGKVRKAKEGHVILSEGPYGYKFILKTAEKQGYLEANEVEAKIVRLIFGWVAEEGLTMRVIVRRLQEMSIKPRKSKRGVWNTSTLSTLLRNRTYIGEGHYGASYAVVPENPLKKGIYKKIKKTSRRMKPEEEWIKIPTPAIIEKELFDRVQQRLKDNFAQCIRNKKNEYLLSGKIYCTCGRKRTGEGPMHGKHLYYRCTDRVYSHPLPPKCREAGLNARIVDNLVWKRVSDLMTSPERITIEADRWLKNRKAPVAVQTISVDHIEKEIEKLKKEEERYVKAYGAEAISLEQLKEHTAEIKEQVSTLRGQEMYVEQQRRRAQEIILPSMEELEGFCKKAQNMISYLNFGVKQKIVRELIDKVIGSQKELLVEGYLPINNQDNYVEYKTINRNCRSSKRWKIYFI